ncbi:hypothetical protein GCM10023195_22310 [Actinoallomurus liliacearum]|uniref:Uncharacterized protein n=1 Tax=Actinoallomurus liliacearum TaxID=1080073 RepID=A0ABP8TID8_9ACTN
MTTAAISPGRPPARRAGPAATPRSGRRAIRITDLRSSGLPVEDGSAPPEVVVPAPTGGIGVIGDPAGGINRVRPDAASVPGSGDRTGGIGRVVLSASPTDRPVRPAGGVSGPAPAAGGVPGPGSPAACGDSTGGIGRVVSSASAPGSGACPCGEAGRRADR